MRAWRWVVAAWGVGWCAGPAAAQSPVALENARPGDTGWRLVQRAAPGQLEAYASATSVRRGEAIGIHARADGAHTARWALYRMGWYGGARGRRIAEGGPVPVGPQPTPAPDPATGRIACTWPETFRITTGPGWTSGIHLLVLTRDDGAQTYVPLVVRDDERRGVAVLQSSVTTWQAYNWWGGESLYSGAYEVSFDRPYADANGAGQYFRWEHDLVAWAERRGLDVVYATNVDLDRDPGLLVGQRLFVSMGHDEYWSRPARRALEAAIQAGTSVAFLSANSVYWQVRLEPGSAAPARTVVCYKEAAPSLDPLRGTPLTTVRWRDPPVSEPENALLGSMYTSWLLADTAWVVTNARHWLYEGTGLADGDAIPGVVGYETDRRVANGHEPPGVEVVARAPVGDVGGRPDWHEAVVRATPAGGFVFAAGTIELAWALGREDLADPRLQRMAENLFRRAGLAPTGAEDPVSRPDPLELPSGGDAVVTTLAGAPFQEGLVDGAGARARFSRPTAAVVDGLGRVWVSDTGNHAVRVVHPDPQRTVETVAGDGVRGCGTGAGARLDSPQGLAVDADGSVFVADTGNHRIVRIRDVGGRYEVERVAGGDGWNAFADGPADAARFFGPGGLARAGGDLFVADRENHAIRRLDASGHVTTVAGVPSPGLADGSGADARFFLPSDVAVVDGALAVLDAGNRRLRRLELGGGLAVSTSAGAGQGGFADGPAAGALLMANSGLAALEGGGLAFADGGNARVRLLRDGVLETLAGDGLPGALDGAAAEARFALPTAVVTLGPVEWLVVDGGASTLRLVSGSAPPPPPPPPPAPPPRSSSGAGGGCQAGEAGAVALAIAGLTGLAQRRRRPRAGRSASTAP